MKGLKKEVIDGLMKPFFDTDKNFTGKVHRQQFGQLCSHNKQKTEQLGKYYPGKKSLTLRMWVDFLQDKTK